MPTVSPAIFTPVKFSVGPGSLETEVLVPPSASSVTVRPVTVNAQMALVVGTAGKMGSNYLELTFGTPSVVPTGTAAIYLASTALATDVEVMFTASKTRG
jgi:hypothetical protein